MQLVDTHVHINFKDFNDDLPLVRSRWQEAGVTRLVHSCVKPSEFSQIQAIANQFPELSFAVGLHPLDAHTWQPEWQEEIFNLASSDRRVVAIGETGLDFYKAENKEQQILAFQAQLDIAHRLNIPVIIHCRDAAIATREVLAEFNHKYPEPITGVMHCWAGNPEETQWFVDLGMYISFSGVVTFKNAQTIQASAQIVPSDRLLIETDCPFLAPMPNRGKRNEPAFVLYVAQKLAEIRGEPLEQLAEETTQNALRLFKLV
ncbi:hydrolase, TatD family [Synechococcus sp. PCC 7502]|uniref:TatD family hydrolase n=1 Tax=Synechococcus sp. PCC 7502 TaxID=1173263 RepID=UPI00029FEFF6|nr:TatD family hydrolase [Synechococcus sp. PCC 7502]AFY72245.1 hydrolase, TatD family [Synechococcus sp. PCC 7502]